MININDRWSMTINDWWSATVPTARSACLGSLVLIWIVCLHLRDPSTLVPLNSDSSRELTPQFHSRGLHFLVFRCSFPEGVFSLHMFRMFKNWWVFAHPIAKKCKNSTGFCTSKFYKVRTSLTKSPLYRIDWYRKLGPPEQNPCRKARKSGPPE